MASNPQRVAYGVFNGYAPQEGPKALPIAFDFTSIALLEVNLLNENTNGVIQYVQSVWVENHLNPNPLIITIQATGQIISVPAFSQGLWPVISIDQSILILTGTVNALATGKIILLNVPMSYFQAGPQSVIGDVNATLTAASINIYRGSYNDFSGTITTGGVSQNQVPANLLRKQLIIQNPTTATEPLWFNFTNPASAGVGSFSLAAGDFFITNMFIPTSLVSVFAVTTGHIFAIKELV